MAHSMDIDNGSSVQFRDLNSTPKPSPEEFKIIFVDVQEKLVSAWQDEMKKELPSTVLEKSSATPSSRTISVATYLGYFQDFLKSTPVDCMVSPANSFGLMDGGLDLHISKYYGGVANLVPVVRSALMDEWCGQQNVGTCILVDAHELVERSKQGEPEKNVPRYIAHAPTMRVPKLLHPDDDIAYRCTWALLTAVRRHNIELARQEEERGCIAPQVRRHERINSILCSGFGSGVGQFPLHECARQMVLAVKHFVEMTSKSSTEEDDLRGSSGLMTLWDQAEKIEDTVCSSTPDKSATSPSL